MLATPPAPSRALRITSLVVVGVATAAILVVMRPDLILRANTPTGGDMGAHVFLPAFVRDHLLPHGRIMGWSNDWYAGFPALFFYFPLPILAIVGLDVVLPYGVAFKLVTAAGLLALPLAAYYFARSMGFARHVAAIAAASGGTFVFMESHAIYGGNIKATMAGEFAFGWGLALGLLYLGALLRGVHQGRRFTPLAAFLLALTALSHIIVVLVVVVASLPLLLRRDGARPVLSSWALGFALAAFWALPLLVRISTYTTDMGWDPVEGFDQVVPREFIPVAALGIIGLLWAVQRQFDAIVAIWLAVPGMVGYLLFPSLDFTKLYNARLLPFWYFTLYMFAGVTAGLALSAIARGWRQRDLILSIGTGAVAFFFVAAGLLGMSQIPGWVRWNYTGYEGKGPFAEYQALMEAVDRLPAGRILWEANNDMGKYGTPMALMLFPYWTGDRQPSMEGLYFESSITTPFHFLNAAEVSLRPSNPVRGLDYHNFDLDRAMKHLPVYDIRYYVTFTPEATEAAASRPELHQVAVSPPWTVFEMPSGSLVDVATTIPAVYTGGGFLGAALDWYGRVDELDRWLVEDGPPEWPRVSGELTTLVGVGRAIAETGTVSNVVLGDGRISFDTTAIGVPHLVKVSDFPNWRAHGATGPYRAAPSLMVVVPTQGHVELTFERTWDEALGIALSLGALVFTLAVQRFRPGRRKGAFAA